jgi:hypothetical protein
MEQVRNFGDERQIAQCAYCGSNTMTRDHVPSRVLLDQSYPANLPVVPACRNCNQGFSADEEYVACLIDCVLAGAAVPSVTHREKIRRILSEKPALAARLVYARSETDGVTHFSIEDKRVKNVVLKLGRGHTLFELNEAQYVEPSSIWYAPLTSLSDTARSRFEQPLIPSLWPEVGSRAMQRLAASQGGAADWIVVQQGRYRYLAYAGNDVVIRIVISEYLACEVIWATY